MNFPMLANFALKIEQSAYDFIVNDIAEKNSFETNTVINICQFSKSGVAN